MDVLSKLLGPMLGSTVGAFHLNSNSHRTGDCPCKLQTSSSSIWTAAETNDFDTVSKRVALNSSLASKLDAYGYTALHYAAQQNHVEIVRFLLSNGCSPDTNSCGATPLHRAAYAGSLESCELLLKAGADPNATDSSYRDMGSPLHKAYSVANPLVVSLLLEYGSNPLQIDANDKTPESLLKKKYYSLFPNLQRKDVTVLIGAVDLSKELEIVVEAKERASIKESKNDSPYNDSGRAEGIVRTVPLNSSTLQTAGLPCKICRENSISFTRLVDGSLICTHCKYKARGIVSMQN